MKSKVNPAAIGIFIAGAILILFVSVVIFGSGKFFRHTKVFLLTFQEPVQGLQTGAPVKLLGVNLGSVQDIYLGVDNTRTNGVLINVLIQIDRKTAQDVFKGYTIELDSRERFEWNVRTNGLRARLDVSSMLSGQLYIALDFYPGTEGFQLDQEGEHRYWEIPTLPSTKREMMDSLVTSLHNLTQFDFKSASDEMSGLLADVRVDLQKLQLGKISSGLDGTLDDLQALLGNPELKIAVTNLAETLGQLNEFSEKLNRNANPLLADLGADLKKAGEALDEATAALQGLKAQVEPTSPLSLELIQTLNQAKETLNSFRQLAQQIQRDPSSLITGKQLPKPTK